jgi:hypothetical protein
MSNVEHNQTQNPTSYQLGYEWGVAKASQLGRSAVQPELDEQRPFHTEYSQVSAIETGFKKLKSNQI